MQTKNVNLLQANSAAAVAEVPSTSSVDVKALAPPLPPRGASNATGPPPSRPSATHPSANKQDAAGVFSPYKPVPLPKPVPPPYRQPPQVPIYSNPTTLPPGTMQPSISSEALHLPTLKRKTQLVVEEEVESEHTSPQMRIPTLAEVAKMKHRPKTANNSVTPADKTKTQHAWTEDKTTDVSLPPRKSSAVGGPTKYDDRMSWEGEALLVRSTSGPLYPCGIDNPAATDDVGYVPSQPHQKSLGSRGQVLLERCAEADAPGGQDNVYRAFCVTTEVDTIARGPEAAELSIREACSRLYTSASTIHSSLQNLKLSSMEECYGGSGTDLTTRPKRLDGPKKTQPYYHLKDMRSGEEEEKAMTGVFSRVSPATKVEVEGVVVYGSPSGVAPTAMKDLNAVELCARSPAQVNPKAHGDSKRMSSTSSESGHGTMQTGAPSSAGGTLNTSAESAPPTNNNNGGGEAKEKINLHESSFSDHFSVTPPLPPLSPGSTPPQSPRPLHNKHKSRRTPDLVETTRDVGNARLVNNKKSGSGSKGGKGGHVDYRSWINRQGRLQVQTQARTVNSSSSPYRFKSSRIPLGGRVSVDTADGEVTSTTTGLDMDSLLDDAELSSVSTSTDDASQATSIAEIGNIRRQLESLEGMYSEVMKVLGLQNGVSARLKNVPETRYVKKGAGGVSLSGKGHNAVTAAPISVRVHAAASSKANERHVHSDKTKKTREKGIGKRFQRLESHVVTLARSVAHLSSEMRTQHMMFQELENLRQEVAQLHDAHLLLRNRVGQAGGTTAGGRGTGAGGSSREWDNFRSTIPSLTNPSRVKKLTHFFGDEPPLLRLFLKKLGYESEKIGIIELPYLTEERLQKIGIPMGPRMRILQEAQMSFRQEHFNIYIV